MKKVSIVVPVYNTSNRLQICMESLIKQTYRNLEIILVDDGSTDDSYSRCIDYREKDNRVIVIHTENQGSGPARNNGIQHATGDYIYFPDSDDFITPNAIERMVLAMEAKNTDLVVFGYRNIDRDNNTVYEKEYEESYQEGELIRKNYADYISMYSKYGIQGAPWNKFFSLPIIRMNKIEYPSLRRHQDDAFIARYMCFAQKVHFIPDILYNYRVNDIQDEWMKYPKNYIDSVIGLYEIRKETILSWNPQDTETKQLVDSEYLHQTIRVFQLAFAPKIGLKSKTEQTAWIRIAAEKTKVAQLPVKCTRGKTQIVCLLFLKLHLFSLLYLLIKKRVGKQIR